MSVFQLLNPRKAVTWNLTEQYILRVLVVFFLILTVPLDWKYFRDLASLDWSGFNYGVLFEITRYFPRFFSEVPILPDVFAALILALLLAWVWQKYEKKTLDFDKVYHFLRVIVRYRLAAALLAYGFIKIFPLLSPYPSLTLLNTPYGDLSAWKIFSLSLGIVPSYQAFLGGFEVLAALLLLNRKTASIGAFIAILFLGNVAMSNLAYEGGEFVYSSGLTLFALLIFAHDVPKFFSLLYLRVRTYPESYKHQFRNPRNQYAAKILKTAFILVFVGVYGILVYSGYSNSLNKYPSNPGISELAGVYDVGLFVWQGDTLGVDSDNPVKWEQVIFEEWATVSIRSGQPVTVDPKNTEYIATRNQERLFESQGIQGWHFYGYESEGKHLHLKNRNPNHVEDNFHFDLDIQNPGEIHVKGEDAEGNEFRAILLKNDKKYLLKEAAGTGRRGKLIL